MKQDMPAFPFEYETSDGARITHNGMSLRDYFAGQALIGYLHASAQSGFGPPNEYQAKEAARNSYVVADAMIAERNKK